jgi:hypothetical protein
MKPPPHVSEEEEPSDVPKEEEESPGIEEKERCDGPLTSPLSRPMKPPPDARKEEQCGE